MSLDVNQINQRLQKPKYKSEISQAIQHEQKIRMHSETIVDDYMWQYAFNLFLAWVEDLLPSDKFLMFTRLIKFPLKTNGLVSDIFTEFERIFEAKNSIFNWEFTSRDYASDFDNYRSRILKEPEIWRQDGFMALKTMINSIVIIDMPLQQTTPRPEPYFYFLDIQHVIDCDFTIRQDELEFVIFKLDEEKKQIACFDDASYKILEYNGIDYQIVTEHRHNLKYCPAKFFYSRKMTKANPIVRESEISKALDDLNWYLFSSVAKKYMDLYVPFPIYTIEREDCDYKDDDGNYCDGGILRNPEGGYTTSGQSVRRCPICSQRNILGVGTILEKPPRQIDDPESKAIERLDADVNAEKFFTEEIGRLEKEIFFKCAGEIRDVTNDQAKNELQVKSQFESRKNILIRIKKNFDIIHKFTTDTICKLRYGDAFIDSTINYGSDYFLRTTSEYMNNYDLAKKSGTSDTELEVITDIRLSVEYRDNNQKLERLQLLRDLEPYQHKTTAELTELLRYSPQVINLTDVVIKLNFTNFIARFEAENENIREFGSQVDYSKKLQVIKQQLKTYADEYLRNVSTPAQRDQNNPL